MNKKLKIVTASVVGFLLLVLFLRTITTGPSIEVASYILTGEYYLKNNSTVFYKVVAGRGCDDCAVKEQAIVGADPKTFEVLNRQYVRDKDHVYVCSWTGPDSMRISIKCETLQNIDNSSFGLVGDVKNDFSYAGDYYAKDKDHVYFYGKPIENGDPQTFRVVDDEYATDKNKIYFRDNYSRFHVVKEVESSADVSKFFSEDHESIEEEMREKVVPTMQAFQ